MCLFGDGLFLADSNGCRQAHLFSTALGFVTFPRYIFGYVNRMKLITKPIGLAICSFGLSSCVFTGDVLQAAYDNKAEEDCLAAYDPADNSGISCKLKSDKSESKWEKYRREDVLKKQTNE